MSGTPYLTKSSYVRGLTCRRMLWRSWHRRLAYDAPPPGSPAAVGIEIGAMAHHLFPGGVVVEAAPWEHEEAVERTRHLMADHTVPAIFEAALEHACVRIRADVLERLGDGRWGLVEVKSATKVKAAYVDDAAVQAFVLEASGIELGAIELMRVNTKYVYAGGAIDWPQFFVREDVEAKVRAQLPGIADEVSIQLGTLSLETEPPIEPGPHCPAGCDFWDHCTAAKPHDWIFTLPRLSRVKFDALQAAGIERISQIPDDFALTDAQDRMRDVVVGGRPYLSRAFGDALRALDGPVAYLDFEAMNPAVPLYPGTRPYQRIAFQWSLHRDDGTGRLTHAGFLGEPGPDPREGFVCSLVRALDDSDEPIVVYSAYERSVLAELALLYPDHAPALERIVGRLVDLYVVVRDNVYLEGFNGSLSIKRVGKTLAPGLSYEGLDHVADGATAAAAYLRMARGQVTDDEARELTAALSAYCRLDTLAMVEAHRGLVRLVDAAAVS